MTNEELIKMFQWFCHVLNIENLSEEEEQFILDVYRDEFGDENE
jgi:hypothetical protein